MLKSRLKYLNRVFLIVLLFLSGTLKAQINTDRVMDIGRNALFFEDYVLSIQYFNQVISAKPYLCEPFFFRGLAKLNLDDFRGAEEDCTVAIECNPFVVNAYQVRGLARINMEDYEGAAEDYSRALKYDPENIGVLHNISMCYLQEKKYEKADSILNFLLMVSPRYNDAYILKSQVELERGDTLAAEKNATIAVERDPYESKFWSARASIRLMLQNYEDAEKDLTQSIRLGINNAGNYINRALARYNLQNLRGALADYDEALDLEPNNYIGLYNRGLLRASIGDDNRAIEDFDKVIDMNPKNMMAIFNRAILREKTGDFKGAISDYSSVLKKYPKFAYGYQRRADLYRKTGQKNLAIVDEDKLLRMALDEQFGDKNKKKVKQTRKESDEDMDNYDKLVVADDNDLSGYNNDYRGRVQNNKVDIKMQPLVALTYYEKSSELQPHRLYYIGIENLNSIKGKVANFLMTTRERPLTEDEVARHFALINGREVDSSTADNCVVSNFLRAIDFYLVQDFDSALSDIEAVLVCNPEYFPAYFVRANILCKKLEYEKSQDVGMQSTGNIDNRSGVNEYDLVLRDLDKVISLVPDFAYAYYNRACVKAMLKDFIGALDDLNKCIDLDNSFAEAYYNRGLINVFMGNNKQGIADLSRAGELGIASSYNVIKRFVNKR